MSCPLQKEYDIVTNDYERAKSLFAGTKVKVFSKGRGHGVGPESEVDDCNWCACVCVLL